MGQVVFDPVAFKLRYPEFSSVSDILLGLYFEEATLYLSNLDDSPVQSLSRRAMLLNMLVAHICALYNIDVNDGSVRPVGRTSSATEGSVSAAFEYVSGGSTGTYAWFIQTPYGSSFWQATSSLRGFQYRARPTCYR
jgi:hypothetical protein